MTMKGKGILATHVLQCSTCPALISRAFVKNSKDFRCFGCRQKLRRQRARDYFHGIICK